MSRVGTKWVTLHNGTVKKALQAHRTKQPPLKRLSRLTNAAWGNPPPLRPAKVREVLLLTSGKES